MAWGALIIVAVVFVLIEVFGWGLGRTVKGLPPKLPDGYRCPNCGVEMDATWHADIVLRDAEDPGGVERTRYWECQKCHQFVTARHEDGTGEER